MQKVGLYIIDQCKKGHKSAQKEIYQNFLPYLLTIVRRYGIPSLEQKDYIQEIFIEVFSNINAYDHEVAAFSTWIRTLAVRKILNLKRKNRIVFSALEEIQYDSASTINYQEYDTQYILDALIRLPDNQRTVFNMYEIDGYNHKEIAEFLNISESSSRSCLTRAKKKLIQLLELQNSNALRV